MTETPGPGGPDEAIELVDDSGGLDPEVLRRRRELVLAVLAGLLVLAAAIFTAGKLLRTPPHTDGDVLLLVQDAIRRQMGPGVSVEFSPEAKTVTTAGVGVYRMAGMFTAVGQQRVAFYYTFDCSVKEAASGELQIASLTVTRLF